ncbi:MAG: DUF3631 domain-containing protein [Candidatus Peregrinibacteria bacterium]|nr:DUF3631 domain-containing protein [Candidatus Peregrinibacteria bacterium]MCB9807804.1 DUF3631 domain-containing protein [Candidatus Peribacteria bacterium]
MANSLTLKEIEENHQALLSDEAMMQHLLKDRCFSKAIIEDMKLGLYPYKGFQWFSFPIYDREGKPLFKKLKKLPNAPEAQMKGMVYPAKKKASLYPAHKINTEAETLFLVEGEPDALAARSQGLEAFSGTAGTNTFEKQWMDFFPYTEKKYVYAVYDNDEAGRNGKKKALSFIAEEFPEWELFSIEWSEDFPEKGDLTDFLLQLESKEEIEEELKKLAKPYKPPTSTEILLEELDQDSEKFLLPMQHFSKEAAYFSVPLRKNGMSSLHIVTSERECFPCDEDEIRRRGYKAEKMPTEGLRPRWRQQDVVDFLQGGRSTSAVEAYDYTVNALREHIDFVDDRHFSCTALWIIGTYFYRLFAAYPYLHINGEWGSGKTKALQIISLLSFNGELLTASSSPASIVRLIDLNCSTCCIDEVEELWNAKNDFTSTLQEILRSGYKRGIQVTRCEPMGSSGKHQVVTFNPYSPKVLAGIESLSGALYSRCIQMIMIRTRNQKIANKEVDIESEDWASIRSMLYEAALCNFQRVKDVMHTIDTPELLGREAELWTPLLALAKVIDTSGGLFTDTKELAIEIQKQRRLEDTDIEASKILTCLYELLKDREDGEPITAREIFDALFNYDEEFGWLEDHIEKRRRNKWLNSALKRLGLWTGAAKVYSISGDKMRGYQISLEKVLDASDRFGVPLENLADRAARVFQTSVDL